MAKLDATPEQLLNWEWWADFQPSVNRIADTFGSLFDRIAELEAERDQLEAALAETAARCDAYRAERDRLRGELATVLAERDAAVLIGTQLERERDDLQRRLDNVVERHTT